MARVARSWFGVVLSLLGLGCTSVEVPVAHIESAGPFACALRADGTVACWGDVLGDFPTDVEGIDGARALSMGTFAVCVIRFGGEVVCAQDLYNQGAGAPAVIDALHGASQISVGAGHACALMPSGHIMCWGENLFGQLGDGSFTDSDAPVEVKGLSNAVEVAAGEFSSCARLSDGSVTCWGRGILGQLGGDAAQEPCVEGELCAAIPSEVPGVSGVRHIAAGLNAAVALRADGSVMSWGWAPGDGSDPSAETIAPIEVIGVTSAVSVYAGYLRKCAALADGDVLCWGEGVSASPEAPVDEQPLATKVDGLRDVIEVTGGWYHLCALQRDGEVLCWGDNGWSQLGNGKGPGRASPTAVKGL